MDSLNGCSIGHWCDTPLTITDPIELLVIGSFGIPMAKIVPVDSGAYCKIEPIAPHCRQWRRLCHKFYRRQGPFIATISKWLYWCTGNSANGNNDDNGDNDVISPMAIILITNKAWYPHSYIAVLFDGVHDCWQWRQWRHLLHCRYFHNLHLQCTIVATAKIAALFFSDCRQ